MFLLNRAWYNRIMDARCWRAWLLARAAYQSTHVWFFQGMPARQLTSRCLIIWSERTVLGIRFITIHLAFDLFSFQQVYQHFQATNISDGQLACLLLKIEISHGAQCYYGGGLVTTLQRNKCTNVRKLENKSTQKSWRTSRFKYFSVI